TASRHAVRDLGTHLAQAGLGDHVVVCGYLDQGPQPRSSANVPRGAPVNAAAVIHDGQVVTRAVKHHLPNHGPFDEHRYFLPGSSMQLVTVHGVDIALTIGEDLWQEDGPVAAARASGAGLLLSLQAAPYELTSRTDRRLGLVTARAGEAACPVA